MSDRSGRTAEAGPDVDAYLAPLFWPENEIARAIVDDTRERGAPPIHAGAESARVLAVLATAIGARRVLEVGTLFGYTAVTVARALPPGSVLDSIEFDPMHADAAELWAQRAGLDAVIRVHRGRALDVLPGLEPQYDMAFLDAVKSEYVAYLDACLRLVRPGGLICADNAHWGGRVADPGVTDRDTVGLRAYLHRIASDPRLVSTVLPVGDGLAVSVVREG